MSRKYIAKRIIDYLGGSRFLEITGIRNFIWDDESLTLALTLPDFWKDKTKCNRFKIQYNLGKDSYNVTLGRESYSNLKQPKDKTPLWQVSKSVDDIIILDKFCLADIFSRWTGFHTYSIFLWLDRKEKIKEIIKAFITKCFKYNDSKERAIKHAVDKTEFILQIHGITTTPEGAMITYNALEAIVGYYANRIDIKGQRG
jgi:hypothetical protein